MTTTYLIVRDDVCINAVTSTIEKLTQNFPGHELFGRADAGFDIDWIRVDGVWQPPEPRLVSELPAIEFLKRIPMAKRIAIRQSADPIVKDILGLLDAADLIRRGDPDTIASLGYLMSQELLTQAEADQIWQ